jgi:hypothetical protein
MKRPFDGDARSWLPRCWIARSTEFACRVAADHGPKKDLTIVATFQELVEPETAGDPMTGQIWVRSSLRRLRDRPEAVGHPVSAPTVGRLLKDLDYALHVNAKKREASSNRPDRDSAV